MTERAYRNGELERSEFDSPWEPNGGVGGLERWGLLLFYYLRQRERERRGTEAAAGEDSPLYMM